jgi:hypothetical protein
MMGVLFDGALMTMSTDQMTTNEPVQLYLDLWTEEDDTEYQAWLDLLNNQPSDR